MTGEQMLITAVSTLASVVLVFAGIFWHAVKDLKAKYDVCDKDRLELWKRISRLEGSTCTDMDCADRRPLPILKTS